MCSQHEPGPQDPPGPRYESFDSGPSFGNKGPLPDFGPSTGPPPWTAWEVRRSRHHIPTASTVLTYDSTLQ
jgi:hypothetical protein